MTALVSVLALGQAAVAWAAAGDLDSTFGGDGITRLASDQDQYLLDVATDSVGRYVAVGSRFNADTASILVARFTADGTLDSTFGEGGVALPVLDGDAFVSQVKIAPDDGVLVLGSLYDFEALEITLFVLRLSPNGTVDQSFGNQGAIRIARGNNANTGELTWIGGLGLAVTPTAITVADVLSDGQGDHTELRRFTSIGQPEPSFGTAGIAAVDVPADVSTSTMSAVTGGYAFAATAAGRPAVIRTDDRGALDTTFGDAGVAAFTVGAAPDPDGSAFSLGGNAEVVEDSTGELLVSGTTFDAEPYLAKLDGEGALLDAFGIDGVRTIGGIGAYVSVIGFDTDDRPLLAVSEDTRSRLVRLLGDGRRDDAFGDHGTLVIDTSATRGVAVLGGVVDGERMVLGGIEADRDLEAVDQHPTALVAAVSIGGASAEPGPAPVDRIASTDRIATAIAASKDVFVGPDEPSDVGRRLAGSAVLASADGFADALVGGPLAASVDGPLLLTGRDRLDPRVATELERLLAADVQVHVLGGDGALSDQVNDDLNALGFSVVRYAGRTRYETALRVAESLDDPFAVVLASGHGFADALAGDAAAIHVGGVVLLSDGKVMPSEVRSYIDRLGEGQPLYAVGGDAAAAARDAEPIVGVDRYDTARKVAERFFLTPDFVGLATGERFADALSGGVHAAMHGGPLLLTPSTSLGEDARSYLAARSGFLSRVTLYGGTAALSPAVEDAAASG